MKINFSYRLISKIYDLCEIFFFSRKSKSPRQTILNYLPEHPVKILDVCTGTAINGILIAEQKLNSTIVGIDISKDMLAIANKKIAKKQLHNIQTVVMNAVNLDFEANDFDIVIISLVLHEVGKPLAKKILDEAKKVLKPDGLIFVIEWEQPKKLFQKLMFLIVHFLESKNFKHFLELDFNKFFRDNGLKINRIHHCDYTCIFKLSQTL